MKLNNNICLIGLLSVGLHSCKAEQEKVQAPNVIYVFPDQYRNHAMGFWRQEGFREHVNFKGDPVVTPNLDKFAKESVVLTSAQSNCPLSSPHRGMLLSGMYPNKSGVSLNCNSVRIISSLREDLTCIGDVYKQAGYDCAYFGKWHADCPAPHKEDVRKVIWDTYTPKERRHGFDYWYSYGVFDDHKNPHYWDTEGVKHEPHEWSPLHEASKVVSYLKNENNVRDTDKPFFIMVGMNPPHHPYKSLDDCMEEDFLIYKDKPLDSLLIRPNVDFSMKKTKESRYYFAAVTGVDRAFGQILETLDELGLSDNTIVVFASDHGETMCSQGVGDPKNSPFTESMNIPFLVRYPKVLKPHVDDLLLSTPDIMPTLLGLSGLEKQIPAGLQGINYASIFIDPNTKVVKRPESAIYIRNSEGDKNEQGQVVTYFPEARGIKTAQYTLAFYIDKKEHKLVRSYLFDDLNDPYQLNNLSLDENKEIVESLCKQMGRELTNIEDPWSKEKILSDFIRYE